MRKFPMFIENSWIPVFLSNLSPIEIGAITLGPFIFSRGEMSERTKNHERIHWEQYKETLVIGFLFLYAVYYLLGRVKYRDGQTAYFRIPFEQEAYENDSNMSYIDSRKKYEWSKFKI